jgi:hypothetical protein
MPSATKVAQVRLNQVTPSPCRVVLDNPPRRSATPSAAVLQGNEDALTAALIAARERNEIAADKDPVPWAASWGPSSPDCASVRRPTPTRGR